MDKQQTIINIGRQFGSGGRIIAQKIGKALDIPVYNNELIIKAAEESGFSKELFEKSDEKKSLWGFSAFFTPGKISSAHTSIGGNDLFMIQSDVIRKIADSSSAVFVGRCSNYILRDRRCLDVFITSPADVRAKRVAQRESITEEEAREMIGKQDRTRAAYYNFYTLGNWGAASDYDLCIDSSILGEDATADFIIEFGRKAGIIEW
jgi:Cytidylate kinase